MLKTISGGALAAVLFTATAALAQASQAPPANAPPAGQTITCPKTLPANPPAPAGFSRVNPTSTTIDLDYMEVDGGQLYCSYGSITVRSTATGCVRASGPWRQSDGTCFIAPPGIPSPGPCYARCQ
ncbi:hypothetical protein [Phenylobacterium sp.]